MPSWLGGSGGDRKPAVKDVIKYMYPKSTTDRVEDHRTRFSTLLLEHGEKALQDWAVLAYSSPWETAASGGTDGRQTKAENKIQWAQSKPTSTKNSTSTRGGRLSSPSKKANRPVDKDQFPS